MQPISGPIQSIGGPSVLGGVGSISTTAPSSVNVMGAIGGITSVILGEAITSTIQAALPPSDLALSSVLSGSIGALMKEEEEKKEPEDWQVEISERKVSKKEEDAGFMKSICKKQTKPGKSGLQIPGLEIEAIQEFVK